MSPSRGLPEATRSAGGASLNPGETNPCKADTDGDGIQDGTEKGLTSASIGADTDTGVFIGDADPGTTTNPLDADSDKNGYKDGQEDLNKNGKVDAGESDPNKKNSIPSQALIFPIKNKDGNVTIIYVE
jgi:hypothetical protein